MTNININDNRENPIQTIIGVFLAVSAGAILFGLIPGFLIASIVDLITPLKTGPIWAIALLSTIAIIYVLVRKSKSRVNKALINYVVISAASALILGIGALFTQGDVFYGFTAKKMFCFLTKSTSHETFQDVELYRGREKTQYLSWEQIKEISSTENKDKYLQEHGFLFVSKDSSNNYDYTEYYRRIDNIETCFFGTKDSHVEYYTQNVRIFEYLRNSILKDGFSLVENTKNKGDKYWEYRKGNMKVFLEHVDYETENPLMIRYEQE